MKPFDLDAAKRGAAVCTRDSKEAKILTFDCRGTYEKRKQPIGAEYDNGGVFCLGAFCESGHYYSPDEESRHDLMMRDDDYLEKLERGEYGNHIEDKREMVEPVIKQNLTTDREYWRRVYAGMAMQGIFSGRNWRSGEMIPDCIGFAQNAVEIADALIAELEE